MAYDFTKPMMRGNYGNFWGGTDNGIEPWQQSGGQTYGDGGSWGQVPVGTPTSMGSAPAPQGLGAMMGGGGSGQGGGLGALQALMQQLMSGSQSQNTGTQLPPGMQQQTTMFGLNNQLPSSMGGVPPAMPLSQMQQMRAAGNGMGTMGGGMNPQMGMLLRLLMGAGAR